MELLIGAGLLVLGFFAGFAGGYIRGINVSDHYEQVIIPARSSYPVRKNTEPLQ